jgi:bifunctional ADP-heptose synthase (sugar kinase/adenylyltransferase)
VIIFEEDTPLELIKKLRPNYLIKGNDYSREEIIGAQIVLDHKGKVERFPITNNISSTDIITRIKNIDEI